MAREKYKVVNGPSNFDLLFALFSKDITETLSFNTIGSDGRVQYAVRIDSLKRLNRNNLDDWGIKGSILSGYGNKKVIIEYRSNTREGTLSFDDDSEVKEVLDNNRKARALMIVIEKMLAGYQNFHNKHGYEQDEDFFKLFNKAKGVNWATDTASLTEAIKQI